MKRHVAFKRRDAELAARIAKIENDRRACPKLAALMDAKRVWIEGMEYVGRDEDGEYVAVGTVGEEAAAERYLQSSGWFNR